MSGKPEGSGWMEQSVQDRYDSMKSAPTMPTKNADQKPIGDKAGNPSGYKPGSGATDK